MLNGEAGWKTCNFIELLDQILGNIKLKILCCSFQDFSLSKTTRPTLEISAPDKGLQLSCPSFATPSSAGPFTTSSGTCSASRQFSWPRITSVRSTFRCDHQCSKSTE